MRDVKCEEWIKKLEEEGELIRIRKPVDVRSEMGALIWESYDKALLFENIVGYPNWKTLAQAPGTMKQIGLSFGVSPSEGSRRIFKSACPRFNPM